MELLLLPGLRSALRLLLLLRQICPEEQTLWGKVWCGGITQEGKLSPQINGGGRKSQSLDRQEVKGTDHLAMRSSAEVPLSPPKGPSLGQKQGEKAAFALYLQRISPTAPFPSGRTFPSAQPQGESCLGAIQKEQGMAGEKLQEKELGAGG